MDLQCACFAEHSDECVCSGAPPRCEECLDVLSQDRLDGRHLLCYECDPDENSEDAAERRDLPGGRCQRRSGRG